MKALNLKSMSWIMALAMMFIVSFTGCSDDDGEDGGPIAPVFPELKETNCGANETTEISFEANLDWEISSNAGWCKFINGEISESIMSGKAGKQTIKIAVSADGQNYNDDAIAEITLKMGEKSQVIYKIKRAKKEYSDLVITDEEGNVYDAEHPLTIKGSGLRNIELDKVYTIVNATADMTVGLVSAPNWVTVENDGQGQFKFIFNNDNTEGLSPINSFGTDKEYKIIFATEDVMNGNEPNTDKVRKVEIPLAYEGLKDDAISFVESDEELSFQGKQLVADLYCNISIEGSDVSEGASLGTELTWTVDKVRDGQFEIIKMGMKKITDNKGNITYEYDLNADLEWAIIEQDEENPSKITFSVLPAYTGLNEDRSVIVMMFSKAFCDKHKNDFKETVFGEDGYINTEYSNNVMVTLTQKDESLKLKGFVKKADSEELLPFLNEDWEAVGGEEPTDPFEYARFIAGCKSQWGMGYVSFSDVLLQNGSIVYIETSPYKEGAECSIIDDSTGEKVNFEGLEVNYPVIKDGKYYMTLSGEPTASDWGKLTDPNNNFNIVFSNGGEPVMYSLAINKTID